MHITVLVKLYTILPMPISISTLGNWNNCKLAQQQVINERKVSSKKGGYRDRLFLV